MHDLNRELSDRIAALDMAPVTLPNAPDFKKFEVAVNAMTDCWEMFIEHGGSKGLMEMASDAYDRVSLNQFLSIAKDIADLYVKPE